MKNKINISILLLSIFLAQAPAILSAQDNVDFAAGSFVVAEGATVNIGEGATITVPGNITLEADITGAGELILNSHKNSFIDANNYSIENLVLASANNIELLSGLQISGNLIIPNGALQLNNFNLTIKNHTKLNQTTLDKIIENGAGKILQGEIPLCNSATPYTFTTTVNFYFANYPATIPEINRNSTNTAYYYNHPIIHNPNSKILTPPPRG